VNYMLIIEMAQGGYATGMPTNLSTLPAICEHCVLGKQTKKPVSKLQEGGRLKWLLGIVYSDLMGPQDVRIVGGGYILNFIDDCSDMLWIYSRRRVRLRKSSKDGGPKSRMRWGEKSSATTLIMVENSPQTNLKPISSMPVSNIKSWYPTHQLKFLIGEITLDKYGLSMCNLIQCRCMVAHSSTCRIHHST
jgi:hypothetical protein